MEPAVNGTKNVIIAASEAKVRRVVFTSSIGAVYMDPNRSPDAVVDESCWSDLEFCKNTRVGNVGSYLKYKLTGKKKFRILHVGADVLKLCPFYRSVAVSEFSKQVELFFKCGAYEK